MNFTSIKWALSLLAVATCVAAAPGIAHAAPPNAQTSVMPSVRTQIREAAKADGMWSKGTSLRLHYSQSGKTVQASLWNKTTFGGGAQPIKPTRLEMADARFRINQGREGMVATPMKTSGQVWHLMLRGVAPPPNAKH